ncbi:MAG TPA: DNA-binding domain-containing protein [Candidatus Binataceae bacterium]|nr:DNA-binding domain-containing protein [Candidatus Binataceae bacterium]
MNLRELQLGLCRLITATPGEEPAELARAIFKRELTDVIAGDDRLPPRARIGIYAEAYFERLRRILCEEYPACTQVIGETAMSDLVRAYLSAHPPSTPSVFHAGRLMPDFIRSHAQRFPPYLSDLARLERTLIEVFHAPDAQCLNLADLRTLTPAQWPDLVLHTHPALQIEALAYTVGDILSQLDKQPHASAEARPCILLIWRQSDVVYFRELNSAENAALQLVQQGAPFAQVCTEIVNRDGDMDAAAINAMLNRWLADGLLAG